MFATKICVRKKPEVAPENRVGDFFSVSFSCGGQNQPQALEPHQAYSTTDTTIVSGVVYWLSKDPIGISGGLNLYAFCGNNPVNFIDPPGLETFELNRDLPGSGTPYPSDVSTSHTLQYTTNPDGSLEHTYSRAPDVGAAAKFNKGIETEWTGSFGQYDVVTKVVSPQSGQPFNSVLIIPGDGRASVTINRERFISGWGDHEGTFYMGTTGWGAAHEAGHFMGLNDMYNERTKMPYPGWEGTMMGQRGGAVNEDHISAVIQGKNKKPWFRKGLEAVQHEPIGVVIK